MPFPGAGPRLETSGILIRHRRFFHVSDPALAFAALPPQSQVVGTVRHLSHAARRRPRRDDRQHRSAAGADRAEHGRSSAPVGRHRLCPRVRRPATARRPHRRLLGTQAHVHGGHGRVRSRFAVCRHGFGRMGADPRTRASGRVRGDARPRRPRAADDAVPLGQGAERRLRGVRHRRRGGRCRRHGARRTPHRVLRLALVPARQHLLRRGGPHRWGALPQREQGGRRQPLRPVGRAARDRRARIARVRVQPRGERMGRSSDHHVHRHRRRASRGVRVGSRRE